MTSRWPILLGGGLLAWAALVLGVTALLLPLPWAPPGPDCRLGAAQRRVLEELRVAGRLRVAYGRIRVAEAAAPGPEPPDLPGRFLRAGEVHCLWTAAELAAMGVLAERPSAQDAAHARHVWTGSLSLALFPLLFPAFGLAYLRMRGGRDGPSP